MMKRPEIAAKILDHTLQWINSSEEGTIHCQRVDKNFDHIGDEKSIWDIRNSQKTSKNKKVPYVAFMKRDYMIHVIPSREGSEKIKERIKGLKFNILITFIDLEKV